MPPNSKGEQFAPLNIGKSLCRYEKRKTSPDRLGGSGNTKNPFKLKERTGSKLVWDQSMIIDMDEGKGADHVVYISQTEQQTIFNCSV